ncbi:aminotransferase class IV [Methylobacterium sp. E-045]|uniref:aminotransferase class IV n=1 Tax=Methylobacterium sp. E-045 TaxID=2836575 RepID=UPI001FB9BE28|nr:aminotransferase class IV [Methylobacterium sp. E-045]MCJ2131066.1 aminotransferase class IV [Methylobacterium sp. E-045]
MLWFDGVLHEGTRHGFDLADRGLTLGDGLFDTALCLGGRIAFREAHLARLAASADTLGFAIDGEALGEAMGTVAAAIGDGALRTTVTRGSGPRGLAPPEPARPVWWITAAPRRAGSGFAPVSLHPSAIRRNETSPGSGLKTLGYLDAVLAAREARARGFDEALFLNTKGHLACAGTGNLFALWDGRLVTPPLSDGVLPGIVRARVLGLAESLGIGTAERSLALEEVLAAEAVVMTNSLRGLSAVTAIGTTTFPDAHATVAALSHALRLLIAEECGVPPEVA